MLVAATALAGCASSTSSTQCLTGELADAAVFPSIVREGLDSAMRQAIGVAPEGFPFGAVLVDIVSGEVVAAAGNQMANGDPSAHAEVDDVEAHPEPDYKAHRRDHRRDDDFERLSRGARPCARRARGRRRRAAAVTAAAAAATTASAAAATTAATTAVVT